MQNSRYVLWPLVTFGCQCSVLLWFSEISLGSLRLDVLGLAFSITLSEFILKSILNGFVFNLMPLMNSQ